MTLCGEQEADCTCGLDAGHDGSHECSDDGCGGRWFWQGDQFRIERIPGDIDGSATAALKDFYRGLSERVADA